MVSVFSIGPKGCWFKPGRGGGFLRVIKVCSTPFFREEVKLSAPCKILWHVRNHLGSMNKNTSQGQIQHFL
jgi:hypothetical protein